MSSVGGSEFGTECGATLLKEQDSRRKAALTDAEVQLAVYLTIPGLRGVPGWFHPRRHPARSCHRDNDRGRVLGGKRHP